MSDTGQITSTYAAESGHFYYPDGRPAYTIIGKNGAERNTTLRDARKLSLRPGVSTIKDEAAKPFLQDWKATQVLYAALTLPLIAGETEQAFVARVIADSKEQARKAADRGTQIHAWIQQGYEGKPLGPDALVYYLAVTEQLNTPEANLAPHWDVERSFATGRFGGKVDLSQPGIVLDIKTKERADKFALYDEHAIQLAAYREGLGMRDARCGIVFVTTTGTPTAELRWVKEEKLRRGWGMFEALTDYYYARTGL